MGWDEIERVGAEAFERWKKAAQTAWDALPGTADAATTAAARQSIGEGAVNTLEGLGTLLGPPAEFTDAAYLSGNADAIALVERARAERLAQARREAAQGKDGVVVKPPLRQEYVDRVNALNQKIEEMRKAGMSSEDIARAAHAERRALGIEYKSRMPPDLLEKIHARNLDKYGDKLGPSIEYLRGRGKTWEGIIATAIRPGGSDLGF